MAAAPYCIDNNEQIPGNRLRQSVSAFFLRRMRKILAIHSSMVKNAVLAS
jgi:hypothetical protein